MKRRILSIILTLAMCLSLLPAMTLTASAVGVMYEICDENGQNWETATRNVYTAVTSSQIQWTGGWYVVDRSITLTGKTVTVVGDVHLILKNGCTLTITGGSGDSGVAGSNGDDGGDGISILSGSALTIYGQPGQSGTLKVIGGNGGRGGGGTGGDGGNGGNGGSAITGSVTIYGGNVIATGGSGGRGGSGDNGGSGGNGGNGGNGGSAIAGSVAIYGGSVAGTGGVGAQGGGSNAIGRGSSGVDGKAITGSAKFAAGYIHLTQAGSDENTVEAMEWTGGPNSFPQETKWVKIQPMRVNGVTITPADTKLKPGETVDLTAKVTVLYPADVGPLNVTKGTVWTVIGGKSYVVTDGKLTVRANEKAKTLTITAKYGTESGNATVTVDQTASSEQSIETVKVGDTEIVLSSGGTATPNHDGTTTVPGGSIVIPAIGPSITVNHEATVDKKGNVTLSGGYSATIGGTTVTVPAKGGTITPNVDNTVSVPADSRVTDKSGKRTTVPSQGGTVSRDGTYEDNMKPVFHDGPSVYPPKVPKTANGDVSVSPRSPQEGDTVTVTPTPDGGYEMGDIAAKDSSGSKLELKNNRDGTYSFTQPGGTVTVEVTFVPRSQELPFFDVLPGDWYYDAVRYMNSKGIMGGYSNGIFRPNTQLSRAMLAQILYNLSGGVPVNYQVRYRDVPADAWYAEAVRWAASEGIVSGYSNGTFKPDAPITREQLAVMLYRFKRSQDSGFAGGQALQVDYADAASIGGYAREAAAWCTANGILGGYADGTLRPKGLATRAQTAAMLMRFCEMS